MAKFVIWAALAAFGFIAAVTAMSFHPQKAEAECSSTDC
jgi:hypothetical protein